MSLLGQIEPRQDPPKKPPKRFWNASEPFVDLRLSHWVEIALVGVGYLQWTVYRRQAGLMDTQTKIAGDAATISGRQADIADKQTSISSQQLALSGAVQRAWIGVINTTPSSPISLRYPSFFGVTFNIKNTGQLPGIDIWIDGEIHAYAWGDPAYEVVARGKEFCTILRRNRSGPAVKAWIWLKLGAGLTGPAA